MTLDHSSLQQRMSLMPGWTTEVVINAVRSLVWEQVTTIAPLDFFVWQGHFGAPFLFTVRHSFIFEAIGDQQTRFTQKHENSGLLIPYLAWRGVYSVSYSVSFLGEVQLICLTQGLYGYSCTSLDSKTLYQGYLDYNQALKEQCESRFANSQNLTPGTYYRPPTT